jgi:hypothetical protein
MSGGLSVGPLSRYFAADEAEAVARHGGLLLWLADVAASLEGRLRGELRWDEDPRREVLEFALGRGELDAVRLLAVHADRPELEVPDRLPDPLGLDPQWAAAEAANFDKSRYGHIVAPGFWLPADFDFTFRGPRPDGADATFGSLYALRDQLRYLNARTFQAGDEQIAAWRHLDGGRFVDLARRGLAGFDAAVRAAIEREMPIAVRG